MAIKIQGVTVIEDVTAYVSLAGTGAVKIPVGTTVQQPTGVAGQIRFNSESVQFEAHDGSAWGKLSGDDPLAQTLALLALA